MYIGSFFGMYLGKILGISGNVGGVGFSMLILVTLTNYLEGIGKPLQEKNAEWNKVSGCFIYTGYCCDGSETKCSGSY